MANKVFNVAVFFVVFREALEAIIVISVLLSFIKQAIGADIVLYKKLRLQIWLGSLAGFIICLIIGGAFIGAYYGLQKDVFGSTEDIWEGIFCMIATIMISIMGVAMLRLNKMQAKWRVKIAQSLVEKPKINEKTGKAKKWQGFSYLMKKYCMFILPFITVLREGLEAVVFVAGAGVTTTGSKASAFPLPVVIGLLCGGLVGAFIFYGGSYSSLQVFLVISTCILYLIAAGLFSRGAWFFENYRFNKASGGDASEGGDGPGSYNILKTVYHINCCNPELDNGWDVFNSLLGWQNTGYVSSMVCYNVYWICCIITVALMGFEEKKGHLPFCKNLKLRQVNPFYWIKGKNKKELNDEQKNEIFRKLHNVKFDQDGNMIQEEDNDNERVVSDENVADLKVSSNSNSDESLNDHKQGEKVVQTVL
ncbi:high-affinity iron permease [Hanseniaspora osmophila]|uniref:Plasma membrane iron permease n=1 Tax=Hanseniaspora osmophila TaxID=56408 RepID=A0A1E5RGI5_9ASCO|nr:Plasma membrane iron permease [Hanseniaspora osmophila]